MVWNPFNVASDYTMKMYDKSDKYADQYNLGTKSHNSPRDAFRHSFTSAMLTKDTTSGVAETLGYANEVPSLFSGITDIADRQDTMMDLHNNSFGRNIGKQAKKEGWSEQQIADKLHEAIKNGQLVTEKSQISEESVSLKGTLSSMYESVSDGLGKAVRGIGEVMGFCENKSEEVSSEKATAENSTDETVKSSDKPGVNSESTPDSKGSKGNKETGDNKGANESAGDKSSKESDESKGSKEQGGSESAEA